jgi:hypothetical protein
MSIFNTWSADRVALALRCDDAIHYHGRGSKQHRASLVNIAEHDTARPGGALMMDRAQSWCKPKAAKSRDRTAQIPETYRITNGFKRCRKCNLMKKCGADDIFDFWRRPDRGDGFMTACAACMTKHIEERTAGAKA